MITMPMLAATMIAFTDGGGLLTAFAAYTNTRSAIRPANPHRPIASRGRVVVT